MLMSEIPLYGLGVDDQARVQCLFLPARCPAKRDALKYLRDFHVKAKARIWP